MGPVAEDGPAAGTGGGVAPAPLVRMFDTGSGTGANPIGGLGEIKWPGFRVALLACRVRASPDGGLGLSGAGVAVVVVTEGTPELGLELDPGPHRPLNAGDTLPGGIGTGGSTSNARTARCNVPACRT